MSTTDSERLPVGQLARNVVRLFRSELAARGATLEGVAGIRPAHLQVFGTIKAEGTRLSELASQSNMSLSSMAELVDDLERLGYLERRPDPRDGRAKLVCLTAPDGKPSAQAVGSSIRSKPTGANDSANSASRTSAKPYRRSSMNSTRA